MTRKVVSVLAAACLLGGAGLVQAGFSDDFESYADTAAMLAPGAWGDDGGDGAAAVLEAAPLGNPGQDMWHSAGSTANHVIDPLTPSDAQPIVWQLDIFDDDAEGSKRVTGGLRDNGAGAPLASILEMGIYNDLANPADPEGAHISGYGIRTVFIGGDPPNWQAFPDDNHVRGGGWHTLTATIRASDILFELDRGADGSTDSQILVATTSGVVPYNILRLGGPSNLPSAGGGASFDNVSINQIPEPTAIVLLGLGGLMLLRRRRTA